uniref:DNA-directed RNA polymerase subunit n=1 Tax=Cacopsylla melanoneura TaxID=428564 RepID=A0A8D9DQT9_9HEMI
MSTEGYFNVESEFCSKCGTILPLFDFEGAVQCYVCKTSYGPQVFEEIKAEYTIHFNTVEREKQQDKTNIADGPIVERKCKKCNNDTMSYATVQLRSADEGQTIFFTCTRCHFKESENS